MFNFGGEELLETETFTSENTNTRWQHSWSTVFTPANLERRDPYIRTHSDFTTLVVDARLLGAFRVCLVCASETTRVSCPLLFYCCILPVPSMANSFSCPWTRGDWKQPSDVLGRALKIWIGGCSLPFLNVGVEYCGFGSMVSLSWIKHLNLDHTTGLCSLISADFLSLSSYFPKNVVQIELGYVQTAGQSDFPLKSDLFRLTVRTINCKWKLLRRTGKCWNLRTCHLIQIVCVCVFSVQTFRNPSGLEKIRCWTWP